VSYSFAAEGRWSNYDKRIARLSSKTTDIKVSGNDYSSLIKNMDMHRLSLDDLDQDTLGDCMNWIGFYYAVSMKENHPHFSSQQILESAKSNIYYIFNNETISYIANYSIKLKHQSPEIWKMNLEND
jgi:hypothetical protein